MLIVLAVILTCGIYFIPSFCLRWSFLYFNASLRVLFNFATFNEDRQQHMPQTHDDHFSIGVTLKILKDISGD